MIVYCICYAASWLLAGRGYAYPAGAALLLAALYLYGRDYRRSGNPLHLRGLFSAFWVGGQGVACLRLSRLQKDWLDETWLCFFLAFSCFWLSYELLSRLSGNGAGGDSQPRRYGSRNYARPLFYGMAAVTAVSVAAFLFEAVRLGFVPLFLRGVPHAYSSFHVTGIHYLTVSCVLTPSLAVLFFLQGGSKSPLRNVLAVAMALTGLVIPILCVSRSQLIFAVALALFTYMAGVGRVRLWKVLALAAAMVPPYILLTVARSHSVEYLNGIFEMKNEDMPIFLSQPYIYIANNYENFNCLVEALPAHTHGLRMLYPLWTLTGLKFVFPELAGFPLYVNKEELTTLTLFYDAYYDFGAAGVAVFSAVLGAAARWLTVRTERARNPLWYLLYAQFAFYMVFSFFTTWFSNAATWFYLAVTGALALLCSRMRER